MLDDPQSRTALIVGAGDVGLEIAGALSARGLVVTQVEMLPEVLPTVDEELGALLHGECAKHGIHVWTSTKVTRIDQARRGCASTARAPMANL